MDKFYTYIATRCFEFYTENFSLCPRNSLPLWRHLICLFMLTLCVTSLSERAYQYSWVEQSIVSHREKQKQKGTDGIGWSIYGGHCKLAFRGKYILYIHTQVGNETRGQGGMFLEREDEGGERELGRKLRILNEEDGENDQGKTWFYLLVPRFSCHCEFVSKAASTSVLCCSRPASSWQYEMAIEFHRGHGRLQLLVRTMKIRSTLQYHLPFCYPPEMTVIKYLCVNNFSYCFLLFIILQHYVRYFVFLPPLV